LISDGILPIIVSVNEPHRLIRAISFDDVHAAVRLTDEIQSSHTCGSVSNVTVKKLGNCFRGDLYSLRVVSI